MSAFLFIQPQTLTLPHLVDRTRAPNPFRRKSPHLFGSTVRIGDSAAVKFGLGPWYTDADVHGLAKEVLDRAEGIVYTIADAAVSSDSTTVSKQSGDWLSGITNYLESVLKVLKDGLSAVHVPYSYGFAIILLTVLVKAVTFPLTKKQVESAMAMRSLQPQIQAIQKRYAGNQERIQLETARLYKLAGVNPLAGCLPTLATIPVWIGLYRALSNVADEGLLTEGFFWIPSLSGPTTIAARQNGSGISWLFPFIDGHPPLGWSDTAAYLVLPVLLVISQYISVQIMQPTQSKDSSQNTSQALTKLLPLMIGYFALSVPSGLSLYWFTNNILSTTQQIWLQKLGGARNPVLQIRDEQVRLEQPAKAQTSVLEVDSQREESRQEGKPVSGGLRRGERFKQIKEEEARRKRQREEEKLRAEEAARRANVFTEGNISIPGSVKTEDETTRITRVNGAYTAHDIEQEKAEVLVDMRSDGVSSGNGVSVNEQRNFSDGIEKEDTIEIRNNDSDHLPTDPSIELDKANERSEE